LVVVVGTQFLSCMLGDATPSLPVLPLLFHAPWPALSLLLSWLSPTVPASFHQASFTKQRYTVTDKTLNIQTDVFLLFSLFELFKKYNLLFDFSFANGHALLGNTSKIADFLLSSLHPSPFAFTTETRYSF
jgi:hypothetical protein